MARFRTKNKWKSLLSGALAVLLLAGAVVGIASMMGKDTKTISSTAFSVGGINDEGNYVKTDYSIYTKDMFECLGLTIEPDFEATGTYQVFYYDSNKAFLGATNAMNADDGAYAMGDTFTNARYARVMITPAVPVDEDGIAEEDFRIRFYESASYAKDYTITVNKEQKYKAKDRVVTFEVENFKVANFTESYLLEDCTETLANRAIINKYIPVSGNDVVITCDSDDYTYKYCVFKGEPSDNIRVADVGFISGEREISAIDDEAVYYICMGFERTDKADFSDTDFKALANSFSICYNG